MELYIRSQNRRKFYKYDKYEIKVICDVYKDWCIATPIGKDYETKTGYFILVNEENFGIYPTEKRALEILDEIQQLTTEYYQSIDYEIVPIYEMPKE